LVILFESAVLLEVFETAADGDLVKRHLVPSATDVMTGGPPILGGWSHFKASGGLPELTACRVVA